VLVSPEEGRRDLSYGKEALGREAAGITEKSVRLESTGDFVVMLVSFSTLADVVAALQKFGISFSIESA
jgi:hypothetical protein